MGQLLLYLVGALVVAAIVFGVTAMFGGGDNGLSPAEPDGHAVPLPSDRPLGEQDLERTTFDTAWRGYRMAQVDQALQRAAYDIGYKDELIGVLEAEVAALREGRVADADALRRAREAAIAPAEQPAGVPPPLVKGERAIEVTVVPAGRSAEQPPGRPAEQPPGRPAEQPAGRPAEQPAEKLADAEPVEEDKPEAVERR